MFCTTCNRAFNSPKDLCRHIRKWHSHKKRFICFENSCRQNFSKLYNYEKHLNRFHLNDINDVLLSNTSVAHSMNSVEQSCSSNSNPVVVSGSPTDVASEPFEASFLHFQESALQYCVEMCKNRSTFKCIISSIENTSGSVSEAANYMKSEILKYLNEANAKNTNVETLIKKFDDCGSYLSNFDSRQKLIKLLKSNGRYVDVVLGTRYEAKINKDGITEQVLKNDT